MPKIFLVILTRSLWMRRQRMCPTTWLGTYHKETETLWRMLRSNILKYKPNNAKNAIIYTGGLNNRSMKLRGTVTNSDAIRKKTRSEKNCFFFFHITSCKGLRSTWCFQLCDQVVNTGFKNCQIVILQKFLDSPTILCHNQRDKFIFHFINIIYKFTSAFLVHKQRL